MSLHLVINEPYNFGPSGRVLVDYKFFISDNINGTYVIFKEKGKELRAFSSVQTRWGLSKFLSLDSFNNPQKGFRDRDFCKIGAELLVSKSKRRKETLTIINPSPSEITPKIRRFSALNSSPQYSEAFQLGGRQWKLKVRPQRNERGMWLSVHLEAQSISPGKLLFIKAILRVLNTDPRRNKEHTVSGRLYAGNYTCGKPSFMPWGNLLQPNGGFIHRNELAFAVKILTISDAKRTDEPVG
ncbi:uncharacterized protein LOC120293196 [Eucalyptus grandis]|uniref:uncharacterized protein LOC120293196 n=1 Tax=Eucalyptus grandis TaxID=71139 RepID=UPI00192EA3B9|nr:uncharacterized protein LOC120293196 [Eucalyptus grandis]